MPGTTEPVPQQRRAGRAGQGTRHVADVRGGGRLAREVSRLLDQGARTGGLLDRATERREGRGGRAARKLEQTGRSLEARTLVGLQ